MFHVHTYGRKFYIIIEGKVSIQIPRVNSSNEEELITVAHYDNGMAFGELALIKDQPRAASIQCEVDTHFAVLSKDDYLNIIGKIESRKLELFIEFLHDIPTFSSWTKKKLELLTYHLVKVPYKRKQIVFSINSPPEYVYIVQEGEFELAKTLTTKKMNNKKESFILKVALLTRGEVFGDEEVLKNKNHRLTCTCYSTTGVLLRIKAEDFKLKVTDELVEEFTKKRKSKSLLRGTRLENFTKYVTSNKTEGVPEKKNITCYTPIPIKKYRPQKNSSQVYRKGDSLEYLEKIRKKALGRDMQCEDFLDLNIGKMILEEKYSISQSLIEKCEKGSLLASDRSTVSAMKCHRPGGYFRGNLKKINIRSDSVKY